MKGIHLGVFISLFVIVSGLGIKAITLNDSKVDLVQTNPVNPTPLPPFEVTNEANGVQRVQDNDPYINCETKSQGTIRMRKSECLASVDCLANGKYYLTKNDAECQALVNGQQQAKIKANPTVIHSQNNLNTQTNYPNAYQPSDKSICFDTTSKNALACRTTCTETRRQEAQAALDSGQDDLLAWDGPIETKYKNCIFSCEQKEGNDKKACESL